MTTRTGRWTTDLLVTLVATAVATGAVVTGIDGSVLRTALVAPFVLFLPGYALVSALFPERRDEGESADGRPVAAPGTVGKGLSPAARVGLAVALSIALLPAVVLTLEITLGGIRVRTGFFLLAAVTVLLTLVAAFRRWRRPATERFVLPAVTRLLGAAARPFRPQDRSLSRASTFRPTSKRGLLVNVLLVASVVAFLGSVAGAYVHPTQGEQFTELYLVTESEDGEFVAADYPRDVDVGQSRPVYATVANHEGETTTYTLVVTLQRVERTSNETRVTGERELARASRTVGAGETTRIRHDLQPSFGNGPTRVQYLLYVGRAPADPARGTAYRSVHLWITVDGGSTGAG